MTDQAPQLHVESGGCPTHRDQPWNPVTDWAERWHCPTCEQRVYLARDRYTVIPTPQRRPRREPQS